MRAVEDLGGDVLDVQGELVEGAILGDFKEDPSAWNTVGQIAVGFVPYAGQAADVRDFVAGVQRLHRNRWKDPGDWFNLVLVGIGFVPGIGDIIKAGGRAAKGAIGKGARWILKSAGDLWRRFGRQIPALRRGLQRFAATLRSGIGAAARAVVGRARAFGHGLLSRARAVATRASAFVRGLGRRAAALARGLADRARSALARARGLLGWAAGALAAAVRGVFSHISGAVSRALDAARRGAARAGDVVRSTVRKVAGVVRDAGRRAADLARAVRDRAGAMQRAARRWISDKASAVARRVREVAGAGVRKVRGWVRRGARAVKERVTRIIGGALRAVRDRAKRWFERPPAPDADVPPQHAPDPKGPDPNKAPDGTRSPDGQAPVPKAARELPPAVNPISAQKQAGHIAGTPQHRQRLNAGKPTSTFLHADQAEELTRRAWANGTPVPGRQGVRDYDFGVPVGRGPGGGIQTRVRVHIDSQGRIHGHPSGPEAPIP